MVKGNRDKDKMTNYKVVRLTLIVWIHSLTELDQQDMWWAWGRREHFLGFWGANIKRIGAWTIRGAKLGFCDSRQHDRNKLQTGQDIEKCFMQPGCLLSSMRPWNYYLEKKG